MPLAPGTRLGPYEVLTLLGAGGMGEVYRARDGRLDRTVAVKTLPTAVAESADARARFEREARAISRVSHPHICTLYDVGHDAGVEYIVMELLEGDTLAARLKKAPLPLSQLLPWGRQIADALAAAHRLGIVHRDLKPGNVMITPSGVKLLDFGLAKSMALVPAGDGGDVSTAAVPAPLTAEGTFLGTAPYMSPEQIQGQAADARSDVFALGAVLYEMATGRRAFAGGTTTAIAGAIVHHDPPAPSALRPDVPRAFDRLVRACLTKDPAARWQSAQDVAFELETIAEATAAPPGSAPGGARRATLLPWALVALATVVAAVGWLRVFSTPPAIEAEELQLVAPPATAYFLTLEATTMALSPDGRRLAFITTDQAGNSLIWIRSLHAVDAKVLPGTERAISVFWAPDGQSIGFFAAGKLKRLDLSSGIAVPVCDVRTGIGVTGTWSASGRILFASVEGEAIHSVTLPGSTVEDVVTPDAAQGETRVQFPWWLPDGRHFLYTRRLSDGTGRLMFAEVGGPARVVMPVDSNVQFVDRGFIVFASEGTLVARRFDPATGQVSGEPAPIADAVRYFLGTGVAAFSAAPTGALVYHGIRDRDRLAWVDRTGREAGAVGTPGEDLMLRLTSDGRQVLLTRRLPATGSTDIWSIDLARDTMTRMTGDDRGSELDPILVSGRRAMVFSRAAGSPPQLFMRDLETGADSPVLPAVPRLRDALDVSPDGRTLIYSERSERGNYNLWTVPLAEPRTPTPLRTSAATELGARFSPDGRYYLFVSAESGQWQVLVAPVAGGPAQPISRGASLIARWNPNGQEIVYLAADGRVVSVPVRTKPALELGKAEPLFSLFSRQWIDFDIAPDGRFLAAIPEVVGSEQPLTARLGWIDAVTAPRR